MVDQTIGPYRLSRKISNGDISRGVPELWQAHDAGDMYYIKIWRRRGAESSDIQAMWNREVRGLMRLQGYPGADQLFVRLRDLASDAKHYYAVLDGGRRMLLSEVLQSRAKHPWLQNLAEVGRRRSIWEGLLRVAEALALLHTDGTLHRSISTSAIFVAPNGQGDFRLSGFEWSLRLAGLEGAATNVAKKSGIQAPELDKTDAEYSTSTDWFDFGIVAADIFGILTGKPQKRDHIRTSIRNNTTLREQEREVILQLIAEDPEQRLSNSDAVLQHIRNVQRELNVATAATGRDLILAVRFSPERELQKLIEASSEGKAPAFDIPKQLDWMKHDLRGDIRVVARSEPEAHYILKGERLEYRVNQWDVDGLRTWDIGFCESAELVPRATTSDQHFSTGLRALSLQLYPHVRRNHRSIRDRCAQWDKIFPFSTAKSPLPSQLRSTHDFFRVTQQLDTLITIAQICPVNVVTVDANVHDTVVVVTPFEEPERTNLARNLGLPSPAEQLRDWFSLGGEIIAVDDEADPGDDRYSFLERRTIGSDTSTAVWRFIRATNDRSGPRYHFRAQGNWSFTRRRLYLAKNHGGTLAQLRRRHKAIENLKSHESLLRLIDSPRDVARKSSEKLPDGSAVTDLDRSKIDVLETIWTVQPSFAIQGPPGTGKTTLIRAFADRLFNSDRSAQILITAHSHHTVDDVRTKLAKQFDQLPLETRPILLRLGGRRETPHDLQPVTAHLLAHLASSDLVKQAPEYLRLRIESASSLANSADGGGDIDVRAMRTLVQDAANVTFSTSNAGELADLAIRGRRFDWSIIEEAGKAHGFDMAVALQESHRLLLIGDHRQLPPFNSRVFKELLGDPLRIRNALQIGAQFAPGLIDSSLVNEEDGASSLADRCTQWRQMVSLFAAIFENSLSGDANGVRPAATLTDQHRMHPDIADLVGRVFYPDDDDGTIINSPPDTRERFSGDPPFSIVPGSWMPHHRIIWCDVPWVQKDRFAEGETDGLFSSVAETQVVLSALRQFQPSSPAGCEIQILSPYNDQLTAIRKAIDQEFLRNPSSEIFRAPFDIRVEKRMGATVDEFQGSEADVVIVSLVRNNALVPWRSVGFLKEANRMNVLLSRARHKLIIVGSWDFFQTRCNEYTSESDEHAYIGRMMKEMARSKALGQLARVSATR